MTPFECGGSAFGASVSTYPLLLLVALLSPLGQLIFILPRQVKIATKSSEKEREREKKKSPSKRKKNKLKSVGKIGEKKKEKRK